MKLVALVFAVAVLATSGCSVSHRSGDFVCSAEVRCSSDRTCVDGFCVLLDGGTGNPDANGCPSQCTSCSPGDKTCTIDCAVNASACNGPIDCPAGWSCNIACTTEGSCRSGVDCSNGKACNITCSGGQSCRDVTCGSGACKVECTGIDACRGDLRCGAACACDVKCAVVAACADVDCTSLACNTFPLDGCTSAPAGCNTCP